MKSLFPPWNPSEQDMEKVKEELEQRESSQSEKMKELEKVISQIEESIDLTDS